MAKTTTANWQQIDTTTLSQGQEAAYLSYKAKYAAMKEQRKAFEELMAEDVELPRGKKLAFGYNFGKLSIAIVDDDKPAAKASSAVSLSTLIKRG